jgi:hypothetical protein
MGLKRHQYLPDWLSVYGRHDRCLQWRKLRRACRRSRHWYRNYLANGDNFSYPDVTSYHQPTSRTAYTTGVFTAGQFTVPFAGTNGNEKTGQFRNPPFIQTDLTLYKNTHITERLNFQFRFEFYNVFNHANFLTIQKDLSQSNFGVVNSQSLPRWWWQIAGKLNF